MSNKRETLSTVSGNTYEEYMKSEFAQTEISELEKDRYWYRLDIKIRIIASIISFILIGMVLLHIYIIIRYYRRNPGTFKAENNDKKPEGHVPLMSIPII